VENTLRAKDNETPVEHDTEELERKQRESYPGLLMFRGTLAAFLFSSSEEKPTSGINNLQFQNAIQIIRALRPRLNPGNAAAVKPPLLIVGPSFSGSLESLHAQLTAVRPERDYSEILVYSGSTTNRESEESF